MLIGFAGQIGAGKDAAYRRLKILAHEMGLPTAEQLAFATKLKQAAAAAVGVTPEALEVMKREDATIAVHSAGRIVSEISVRKYLQLFGTEVGRDIFGTDFWVEQTLPVEFSHYGRVVCITDVRFPNEARRIRALGGVVVRVLNGPSLVAAHASEAGLRDDLITFEIDNSIRNDNFAQLDSEIALVLNVLRSSAHVLDLQIPMFEKGIAT